MILSRLPGSIFGGKIDTGTPHITAIGYLLAFGGVLTVGVIKHRQHKRGFFFGAIMSVITGNDAAVFSLPFSSGCMSAPMAQTNSNEFIALVISGVIIGAIMVFLQPHIETWSIDQRFIFASVLTIVGWLIARQFRGKTHKYSRVYRTVGNALFTLGVGILILPLIECG